MGPKGSYKISIFIIVLLPTFIGDAYAQSPARLNYDTTLRSKKSLALDSVKTWGDSLMSAGNSYLRYKLSQLRKKRQKFGDSTAEFKFSKKRFRIDNAFKQSIIPSWNGNRSNHSAVKIDGGYVSYAFNYRSTIDTPFAESNIGQHNLTAQLNTYVAGVVPVSAMFWGRRSNSGIFRDINDFQVSFDANSFARNLQNEITGKLTALAPKLVDSIAAEFLKLKESKLMNLHKFLNSSLQLQKLIEANETVKVPRITYDPQLPESVNAAREDSLKKMAAAFLELYQLSSKQYVALKTEVDSLKDVYDKSLLRVKRFRQFLSGKENDIHSYSKWKGRMEEFGLSHIELPAKYRWLMGIRKFSIGRSILNQSELTTRNISINGINYEYNSWYILGITAGLIDYRFRDFVVSPMKKSPQYLYLLRIGIGRLEGNHLVLSTFKGQKQLFTGSPNRGGLSTITTHGYSIEGRIDVNRTTYIVAEAAESMAPDFRKVPAGEKTKLGLSDNSNNAYSVKFFSYLPKAELRLEGMYRYAGENFQSFNSFQTNAAQRSWYIKADKSLFKRRLRIAAFVRTAEFINPFVVQQYSSNSVFKSITVTFRKKKWPVLSLGYMPMSQITKFGNQFFENRFQTLNASYFHLYRIYRTRASTTVVFNKFYNSHTDSSFLYYNADNIFISQALHFPLFTATVSATITQNSAYRLIVMDEAVNWNFPRLGAIGMGVKLNRFNNDIIKMGAYLNANIRIGRADLITFGFEKGYLPGLAGTLVSNDVGNIQFTHAFRFK